MTVIMRLEGDRELQWALKRLRGEVREAASKAVKGTALELRGDIVKRIVRGPASGVVYEKTDPERTHQASASGEAPMSDTGRLANSIEFDALDDLTATVGSMVAYAAWLEYGTSRMEPRPYFTPAVEDITPKYIKRMERAVYGAAR
jgi:HK97 gp10 family phage protein